MLRVGLFLVLLASITALTVVFMFGPQSTKAGHTDGHPIRTYQDGVERRVVTRNVVLGNPIPVCSELFAKSTEEGIKRWEDALGVDAFEFMGAVMNCYGSPAAHGEGINGVIVREDQPRGSHILWQRITRLFLVSPR